VANPSAVLAGKFDVRVTHTIMSSKSVGSAECLLIRAEVASYFLFPRVVNRVLVARQIIWSGEDSAAWLPSAGVDAIAFVWPGLAVQ